MEPVAIAPAIAVELRDESETPVVVEAAKEVAPAVVKKPARPRERPIYGDNSPVHGGLSNHGF